MTATPAHCSGAAGGVAGIIAGQPLDVVRVRLQQKSSHTKSLASMWQLIVKQEGMRSLFKGAAYPITTIAMQVRPCCLVHHAVE